MLRWFSPVNLLNLHLAVLRHFALGIRRILKLGLWVLGLIGTVALLAPTGTLERLIQPNSGPAESTLYRAVLMTGLLLLALTFAVKLIRVRASPCWPDNAEGNYRAALLAWLLLRSLLFPGDQPITIVWAASLFTLGWTGAAMAVEVWTRREWQREEERTGLPLEDAP